MIRNALPADAETLAELHRRAWSTYYPRPPEGGPDGTVKLYQFHVDPDHWRSGVGTALHAACVERWRAEGRRVAVLDMHVDNRRAQACYGRMGWVGDPAHGGGHHIGMRFGLIGE
ncbi:GNAT family N-acetyltransferase [Streptomyces sp. NPDC018693]|uniref:GNAT family N-acetyltransferase n=1 Tax=unclassified Streptomyces TaxID=2593676 RepID=UPI0037B8CF92